MTFLSYRPDFRSSARYFLVCLILLLSACDAPIQNSGSTDISQAEGKLLSSATLSYEDRLMMRNYLLQELCNGVIVIARMQERIGNTWGDDC